MDNDGSSEDSGSDGSHDDQPTFPSGQGTGLDPEKVCASSSKLSDQQQAAESMDVAGEVVLAEALQDTVPEEVCASSSKLSDQQQATESVDVAEDDTVVLAEALQDTVPIEEWRENEEDIASPEVTFSMDLKDRTDHTEESFTSESSPRASPLRRIMTPSPTREDSLPTVILASRGDSEQVRDDLYNSSSGSGSGKDLNSESESLGDLKLPDAEHDSDHEEGDNAEFTVRRVARRIKRYADRDKDLRNVPQHFLHGNREIVDDFCEYLKNSSASTAATGETTSTVAKYSGHIFRYDDSWLNFEMIKDPTFRASDIFCFGQEGLKLLSDPREWVQSVGEGKEKSGRKLEKLKSHAALRAYLRHCIDRDKNLFGLSLEGMLVRGELTRDMDSMERKISESNLWNSLQKMNTQQRVETLSAVKTVNPREETNLRESIKTWNNSDFKRDKAAEMKKVWTRCLSSGTKPNTKEFNSIANFVKLELHNLNRDRHAAYKFTNSDYGQKRAKYIPPTVKAPEEDAYERIFRQVPLGWNSERPPKTDPNMEPSGWVLEVLGDVPGMKKQEATVVAFTPKAKEWCERYRTVKEIFFEVG